MKPQNDLAQLRRSVQASWSAYAWTTVIFAAIALSGWLLGQCLHH